MVTVNGVTYGCEDCQRLTSGRCYRHATQVFITGACWPPVQLPTWRPYTPDPPPDVLDDAVEARGL